MASITIRPLQDDLSFGARVGGVTADTLKDEAVRRQLGDLFEASGMILFEEVEPTGEMHVAISNVFGPLKDHPSPGVPRVSDKLVGVIDMKRDPADAGVVEVNGTPLTSWLPWHFDHCYNNELNRAGVLRAIEIAPEGGLTGFVDGIALYAALSPDLRAAIEDKAILYSMNVIMGNMRFGRPESLVEVSIAPSAFVVMDHAKDTPRAIHPAVWTRASGEKVLHVSPWMAEGIEHHEDAEGAALMEAVCQEINAAARTRAYHHHWKRTDMVIWDNWRMLHSVSGMPPEHHRRMQRTTIKGDYGLGRFEHDGTGAKVLEMAF